MHVMITQCMDSNLPKPLRMKREEKKKERETKLTEHAKRAKYRRNAGKRWECDSWMTCCACKRTLCASLHTCSGDITFGTGRAVDRRATLETETSRGAPDHEVRTLANGERARVFAPTPPTCLGPQGLRATRPLLAEGPNRTRPGLIGDAFTALAFISCKGCFRFSRRPRSYISAKKWTACCFLRRMPRRKCSSEASATSLARDTKGLASLAHPSRTRLPPAAIGRTDARTHDH